jgi:hypothetical protein
MTTLVQKLKNAAKDLDRRAGNLKALNVPYLDICDWRDLMEDAARRIEQLERSPKIWTRKYINV